MTGIVRWTLSAMLYLWGGLWGLLLVLLFIIAAVLFPPGSYERIIRWGSRTFLMLIGIRIRVEGLEHVPSSPAVFMSNHVNLFDVFVLAAAIPGFKRGVEAAEHFQWPVWGPMIRRAGNIPIERGDLSAARKSLAAAAEAAGEGMSIVILPEGHRTRDGALGKFKKGPFHMAKAADVPVVPAGLNGMWEIKQYGNPHWRPGKVTVRFGPPIAVGTIRSLSVEQLRDLTRRSIGKLIDYGEKTRR